MKLKNKNIVVIALVVLIVIVLLVVMLLRGGKNSKEKSISIDEIITNNKTAIIYVENSNKEKCANCREIKKYLDKGKYDYVLYDVNKHKKDEYEKMLQSLSINAKDFNYPAIIYVKEGKVYSDIINIKDTKVVDTFIKDYKIGN